MGANIKYKGSTIAMISEGEEATLHTENTILTGDIQVAVDEVSGQSTSSQIPWGNVSNKPAYLASEASLKAFIGQQVPLFETNNNMPSWTKSSTKPSYTYSEIGGTFPGIKKSELATEVNSLVNASIGSKVSDEVEKQLTIITYDDIGGTFPGVLIETDPTVPQWAKQPSPPDYSLIPNHLVIGDEEGLAYDGKKGKDNENQIQNLILQITSLKEDSLIIEQNLTKLLSDIEEKITETEVQEILNGALQEDGIIVQKIDEKISGLSGGGGVDRAEIYNMIDNTILNTFSSWALQESPPQYTYDELLNKPTLLIIGEEAGTAYDGLKGKENSDNIASLLEWQQNFENEFEQNLNNRFLSLQGGTLAGNLTITVAKSSLIISPSSIRVGDNDIFVFPTNKGRVTLATDVDLASFVSQDFLTNQNYLTETKATQLFVPRGEIPNTEGYLQKTQLLTELIELCKVTIIPKSERNSLCRAFGAVANSDTREVDIENNKNKKYIYGYHIALVEEELYEAEEVDFELSVENVSNSLVQRSDSGYVNILVQNPTENEQPANKQFVDIAITQLSTNIESNYATKALLNNYYTKTETYTQTETNNQINLAISALKIDDYAKNVDIENNYATKVALNDYYTKTEIESKHFIDITSLVQTLKNYATNSDLAVKIDEATANSLINSAINNLNLSETYALKSSEIQISNNTTNISTLENRVNVLEQQNLATKIEEMEKTISTMQSEIAGLLARIEVLEEAKSENQ